MNRKDVNSFEFSNSEYNRRIERLKDQYSLLKENPNMPTTYTKNLIDGLNPSINPGGNRDLLGGLEKLIDR